MDWFEHVPKAELHLHLEGAIPLDALWELMKKYGGDPSVPDREALRQKFHYRDFPHFIQTWVWKNGFLREYEDFTWISEAVGKNLIRQNIRYAEVFYSPADFTRNGLTAQKLTEAIHRGLSRVPEIQIGLVADLVRDFGPETAERTLDEIHEARQLGVIGIGIGGSEQDFPPELFEHVFAKARDLDFRTSAHAGEASGSESIWNAVRLLRVDRIGHGTRAVEDDSLLEYLAERQIPLEMCPISNLKTGVVRSLKDHPIRQCWDKGIAVTVSTDDPAMFGNTLAEEYRLLENELNFSRDEIRSLILQSVRSSWLSKDQKTDMINHFIDSPGWS